MKCKAIIQLDHTDGEKINVIVTGQTPDKVAYVANAIKKRFYNQIDNPSMLEPKDIELSALQSRHFYDFLRDFFHLPRRKA